MGGQSPNVVRQIRITPEEAMTASAPTSTDREQQLRHDDWMLLAENVEIPAVVWPLKTSVNEPLLGPLVPLSDS